MFKWTGLLTNIKFSYFYVKNFIISSLACICEGKVGKNQGLIK